MRKNSPNYLCSIELLQSVNHFKGIKDSELDKILENCTVMSLPKKYLIQQSLLEENIFLIMKGRAKLSKIDLKSGRECILTLLKVGDLFDIVTLLDIKDRDISVEAIDDLQLLKMPIKIAHNLLDSNPEFNKSFLPYLGTRIRQLEDFATNLALYNTKTRLMKLILENCDYTDKIDNSYLVKSINDLSHEVLAQMLGSVRKVINSDLQKLKKDNIITSVRGNLRIKDLDKLKNEIKKS
ncbi:Crp/Fnr family transcriptional regulator [Arcobacter sp. L]|jgi:CRP-like cAMP-binding protein|uniref:Crp/Fnr family transcriptional regulator n=1 Tax=Arcobacter sp. L TaxID=944547 RepID=UPI0002296769|nr:Crp/Fnr family transcriptional regulator [Arcobacter sp. L]BAK74327.1 putative transcriptional regulator [Arcobacter sp. L]